MAIYRFTVVLAGLNEISDDLAEARFEAGCDDGSPFSSCGVGAVGFDREADCLESAMCSAVADVRNTGCVVECVKIEHDSPLLFSGAG